MARRENRHAVRLLRLHVRNFKALDELEIHFPPPRKSSDPDVIVMGSKNGLGKTSVLESCALLFLAALVGDTPLGLRNYPNMPVNLPDILIRAGNDEATVEGTFVIDGAQADLGISLEREAGKVTVTGGGRATLRQLRRQTKVHPLDVAEQFLLSMGGLHTEPLVCPHFLYLHSYRKVLEGNPEMGRMVAPEGQRLHRRGDYTPESIFKMQVLKAMMAQAKLFEDWDEDQDAGDVLGKLNDLVGRYAGGKIEKLRAAPDNTLDFRIFPFDQLGSFAFDGLSSGQKEIISTLFLIWQYSRKTPGIVLVDEPELHLNAEWHRDFVRQAFALAPDNQYIIATHSEDVFASVDRDRRLLLEKPQETKT